MLMLMRMIAAKGTTERATADDKKNTKKLCHEYVNEIIDMCHKKAKGESK